MNRRWAGGLGLSLAVALAGLSPARSAGQTEDPNNSLRKAATAAQNKNCNAALGIVAAEAAKPGFGRLSDQVRTFFYQIGINCAVEQKQFDLAERYAKAATRMPGIPAPFWQARFALTLGAGKIADTVTTVEEMVGGNPEVLNSIPIADFFALSRNVKNLKDPPLLRRLLAVLAGAYSPPEPGVSTDAFRQQYAAILAEAGDKPAAAALVGQIEAPTVLMSMSLDPRLREMMPARFDVRSSVERHMARMREIAAAHAGVIRPQLFVAEDLALLGKPLDALAVLDAIDPGKAGGPAYSDQDDQLNWWWDARARAYAMLGRYDDAAAAFAQGKAITENGRPNISQTINLAGIQARFGRFTDALATLAPIGAGKVTGSPFGMMQFRAVHGCASFKAGKIGDAKADLAYMREHMADAPGALTETQLCMDDLDGAAASIIQRLNTPDERVEALSDLSDYAASPSTYPKYPGEGAIIALKLRKDVNEAIIRAGGTRSFNVLQPFK
jgi:tetratricopeptide (TPR) repeat protein